MKPSFYLTDVITSVDRIEIDRSRIRETNAPDVCDEPVYLKIEINRGQTGSGEIIVDPRYNYYIDECNIANQLFAGIVAMYFYFDFYNRLERFYDAMEILGIEFYTDYKTFSIRFVDRPEKNFYNPAEDNPQSCYTVRTGEEVLPYIQLNPFILKANSCIPIITNTYERWHKA